ncbi:MAG: hypothetical protein IPI49_25005, partial [Myxococcales bacterium]|nr:hypothetical protein [Myxococcales bacterium]
MRRPWRAALAPRGLAMLATLTACAPPTSQPARGDDGAAPVRQAPSDATSEATSEAMSARGATSEATPGATTGAAADAAADATTDATSEAPSDAGLEVPRDGAAGLTAAEGTEAFGYRVDTAAARAGGAARVVVRWPAPPEAFTLSPGPSACDRPRAPAVVVDELWGVADVAVALELTRGKAWPALPAQQLVARDCALTPRLLVAAPRQVVLLGSDDSSPRSVRLRRHAWRELARPGAALPTRVLALPWQGHAVALTAPAPESWELDLGGRHAAEDAAHVVLSPHPYAAVTDGDGLAVFTEVPAGEHPVVAWLPARAGGRAVVM